MSRRCPSGTGPRPTTAAVSRRGLLAATAGAAAAVAVPREGEADGVPALASRPPMGWNSWNSFGTTIDEAQARDTAAIMAERLLPFGYDVFTIDIPADGDVDMRRARCR